MNARRLMVAGCLAALLAACNTPIALEPTAVPATAIPPTAAPPTQAPPTAAPPTQAPPTQAPPTAAPPTQAPPTAAPPPAQQPTQAPAEPALAPLPAGALDVQAQAAALLPEAAGDLARAVEWNRYTLSVLIDPAARVLEGQLRLEYTNRDSTPLDRLYFHLYPNLPEFGGRLEVQQLRVAGQPAEVRYEANRYLLRADLPQPLVPGASTTAEFSWRVSAPNDASGRLYGAFNREAGVLALASAYPIAAIVRGGQWDIGRPDSKGDFVNSETALYDVTLRAPADWSLATTGVVVDGRLDAGQQTARIVSGPQRDFMIALTQLEVASAEVAGTRVNSYFRADSRQGGQIALDSAVSAIQVFNQRYGAYPLRELDVVQLAASTFLGVEYPGWIAIEQRLYQGEPGLELVVAHEVGHQWWYSIVGNDVQTAAWLDEALASYSQIVYQEQRNGPAAAERELQGFRERYQRALSSGRDAPVQQPNPQFINNYVLLVYGKAVLFFQALRKQIGEPAFDQFLHDYYAGNRYGYVSGEQLLGAAEGACGCELGQLYADWITRAVPLELP